MGNNNIQSALQMADNAARQVTSSYQEWTAFLSTAGRLYKYPFPEQLMIYTQRPEATACAEWDFWNQRMRRHIRRGSRGIALLDNSRGKPTLRYVFDVADTERRENGRDPVLWQYRDKYEGTITSHLDECFKVPGGDGLAKQLIALAVQFADEHWDDFKDSIMLAVHDSSLDGLDEDNVALRFRNAVTVSLSFLLLARCGFDLDAYFTPEDFACISEFDTRDTVLALGNAVSESAGVILRQVERAVKACMAGRAIGRPAPAQLTENRQPLEDTPMTNDETSAAASVPAPPKKKKSTAGRRKRNAPAK